MKQHLSKDGYKIKIYIKPYQYDFIIENSIISGASPSRIIREIINKEIQRVKTKKEESPRE